MNHYLNAGIIYIYPGAMELINLIALFTRSNENIIEYL